MEERFAHYKQLLAEIGGEGTMSEATREVSKEMMVPMPLHNYEDLTRELVLPWCLWFQSLSPSDKTETIDIPSSSPTILVIPNGEFI